MINCTLLFIIDSDRVLLAYKKRGVGEGYWNGVGGKVEKSETWEEALVRECKEEINVTPINPQLKGKLTFNFYHKEVAQEMYVQVYTCTKWEGEPKETEEMRPKWFDIDKLPLDQMWDDDKYWLPQLLTGVEVKAYFNLNKENTVVDHKIQIDK